MVTFDEIVQHAARNLTAVETAAILGCSSKTIQRVCKAHGYKYPELKPKLILKNINKQLSAGISNHLTAKRSREGKVGSLSNSPSAPSSTDPQFSSPPNDGRQPPGGGLKKLTEEILEDAIVRTLEATPEKGLGVALSFLDKKKSLSVDDGDTNTSRIALDKLHRKREELFS